MSKQFVRTSFTSIAAAVLLAAFLLAPGSLAAAGAPSTGQTFDGDFFIITSINKRKHELFLKAPTEVTQLMQVNDQTVFLNSEGKAITFADLRAGATVYIVPGQTISGSERVAKRIQEGPMTVAILHARYLKQ